MAGNLARRVPAYTGGNGNCIKAAAVARTVVVRDSKDRAATVLTFTPHSWRRFAARTKASP